MGIIHLIGSHNQIIDYISSFDFLNESASNWLKHLLTLFDADCWVLGNLEKINISQNKFVLCWFWMNDELILNVKYTEHTFYGYIRQL